MTPTEIDRRLAEIHTFHVDGALAKLLPKEGPAHIAIKALERAEDDIAWLLALVRTLTKPAARRWISNGLDGIELHDREDSALAAAYGELEEYRDNANDDGWPEGMESIWYGTVEIRERVVETERRPWDPETDRGGPFDEYIDYKLRPPVSAGTASDLSSAAAGSEGGHGRVRPCPDCTPHDTRSLCLTCGGARSVGVP